MVTDDLKRWFDSGMERDGFPDVPDSGDERQQFFNQLAAGLSELTESDIEKAMGILPSVLPDSEHRLEFISSLDTVSGPDLPSQKRLLLGELAVDFLIAEENWDSCIPRLDALICIAVESDNQVELSILFNYRGVCRYRMARYPEARGDLEESLRLAEIIDSDRRRSHARINLGLVLRELGRLEQAASNYKVALELAKKLSDRRTLLSVYQNIGNIYKELGRWDAGRKALESAVRLASELGDSLEECRANHNLGGLILEQGEDLEEAAEISRNVTEQAISIGALQLAARARSNLALAYVKLGKPELAIAEAGKTLSEAESNRDAYLLWRLNANLARAYRLQGEIESAEAGFERTLEAFDELRKTLKTDRDRAEFQRNLQNLLSEYVSFSLEAKGAEIAFARLARSKSRVLLESHRYHHQTLVTSDKALLESIRTELKNRPGSVILDYFADADSLKVFACTPETVTVHNIPMTFTGIDKLLDEYSTEINLFIASAEYRNARWKEASEPPTALVELGRTLLGPVLDRIAGYPHIIVVPQGRLHHIPWQALVVDDGKYLVETHAVSVVPASEFIVTVKPVERDDSASFIALRGSDSELTNVDAELESLREIFGGNMLVHELDPEGRDLEDLCRELSNAGVVHFVGHAEFDSSDPYSSALILSGGGRLGLEELIEAGIDLSGVKLVTLAACETGMGAILTGDEVISIARGFILAGAGCMLVSLWKVADDASALLMQAFYRAWNTGEPAPSALQTAILELLRKTRIHPYFFAPFQIAGLD